MRAFLPSRRCRSRRGPGISSRWHREDVFVRGSECPRGTSRKSAAFACGGTLAKVRCRRRGRRSEAKNGWSGKRARSTGQRRVHFAVSAWTEAIVAHTGPADREQFSFACPKKRKYRVDAEGLQNLISRQSRTKAHGSDVAFCFGTTRGALNATPRSLSSRPEGPNIG